MQGKTRNRLAWLVLFGAVLVIIFMMSGCAMIDNQWAKAKGLVGIEATCEGTECESETVTE